MLMEQECQGPISCCCGGEHSSRSAMPQAGGEPPRAPSGALLPACSTTFRVVLVEQPCVTPRSQPQQQPHGAPQFTLQEGQEQQQPQGVPSGGLRRRRVTMPVLEKLGGSSYAVLKTLVKEKASVTVLLAAPLLPITAEEDEEEDDDEDDDENDDCCWRMSEKRVAIKVTHKRQQRQQEQRAAGLVVDDPYHEIWALQRLSLPATSSSSVFPSPARGVVELIDCMEDDEAVYTVLPYLAGKDLCCKMLARGSKGVSEATARRILRQVAEGLLHMQARGLAHGDVSLENVMMDPSGACKLIDLGLAVDLLGPVEDDDNDVIMIMMEEEDEQDVVRQRQCQQQQQQQQQHNQRRRRRAGKPSYTCPEAVRYASSSSSSSHHHGHDGEPHQRHQRRHDDQAQQCQEEEEEEDALAVDMWSLGVMLFILLTGRPLYTGPDDPAFSYLLAQGLDALVDHYVTYGLKRPSAAAMDLLRRMMAIEPSQRLRLPGLLRHDWMTTTSTTTATTSSPTTTSSENHHNNNHHHKKSPGGAAARRVGKPSLRITVVQ